MADFRCAIHFQSLIYDRSIQTDVFHWGGGYMDAWGFLALFGLLLVIFRYTWDITVQNGRIERKLNLLIRHAGIDPLQGLPVSERVKEIANDPARKIEAIKVYREET